MFAGMALFLAGGDKVGYFLDKPCMFTVSNALLISKATATVCCGGFGLLKPFVIWWQMLCKAVCVECLCWNPCCSEMIGIHLSWLITSMCKQNYVN